MAIMSNAVAQAMEAPAPAGLGAFPIGQPSVVPKSVQEAIGVNRAIEQEATSRMASDPLMQKAIAAQDANAAHKAAALAEAEGIQKEIARLSAEPSPKLPSIPEAPTLSAAPTKLPDNPLRTLGQMLPLLGALSSGNVRGNTVSALNSAAAAMTAAQKDDTQALEQQHKAWLSNMESTLKQHDLEMQEYRAVLQSAQMSMEEKLAKLTGLSAMYKDTLAKAVIDVGNVGGFEVMMEMRESAAAPLREQYTEAQRIQVEREGIESRERTAAADRAAANARNAATITAANARDSVTPNEVEGRLLAKIAGEQPLTAGEQQAWDKIVELRKSGSGGSELIAALAAGARAGADGGRSGVTAEPKAGEKPKAARAPATPPPGAPANARQGTDGKWYVPDPARPGKFLMVTETGG